MNFVQDTLAILQKRELMFLESQKESEGIYSFLFEKDEDLNWKAGQHGLFTITHKKIKKPTRPFTIASAPKENVIRITTRIGDQPSEFKSAMLELTQGMKIKLNGPVGKFYLNGNSPTLLVAGGMGITPFRSIVKQLEAEGNGHDHEIQLLYLDSKGVYPFKDEFDAIAAHSLIDITYVVTRDELRRELDNFLSLHKNAGTYYIAGPKQMVKELAAYLKEKDIAKRKIIKDVFLGY